MKITQKRPKRVARCVRVHWNEKSSEKVETDKYMESSHSLGAGNWHRKSMRENGKAGEQISILTV
jgi:hypothetical protein